MSFSSAVRRSGIPSVLVWFLGLLQGHILFKMHVMFMLCCGVGGGGDDSRQVLYF